MFPTYGCWKKEKKIGIIRETPRPHNTSVDLLKYSLPTQNRVRNYNPTHTRTRKREAPYMKIPYKSLPDLDSPKRKYLKGYFPAYYTN